MKNRHLQYMHFGCLAAAAFCICMLWFPLRSYAEEQEITSVIVYADENPSDAGTAEPVRISAGVSIRYEMTGLRYDVSFENWKAGTPVGVTLTFRAKDGWRFSERTGFQSSTLSYKSRSGDGKTVTVSYSYTPKTTLSSPAAAYHESDNVVRWEKVSGAKRYLVKILEDGEPVRSFYTTGTSADLSGYGSDGEEVRCLVSALSSLTDQYTILRSFEVEPEDGFWQGDNTVSGRFCTAGTERYFRTEDGSKATGWQLINGYWYHFDETTGYAFRNGWFKDRDGHWYCFDQNGKMKTGWITDGGYRYFLNNTDTGVYGAMVTGTVEAGPGGKSAFLNDGSDPDVPLGAQIR